MIFPLNGRYVYTIVLRIFSKDLVAIACVLFVINMFNNQFALDFIFDDDFGENRSVKIYRARRNRQEENSYDLFRFSDPAITFLANEFLVDRKGDDDDEFVERIETRGGALEREMRMKVFLRYLSDPGFQVSIDFRRKFINQYTKILAC